MKEKVLGILVDQAQEGSGNTFGLFTNHLRDLMERAIEEKWVAYVFSAKDVLKQRSIVWGWSRSEQKWQRAFFPIPDICYIRKFALGDEDDRVLEWLIQTNNTQFINQPHIENLIIDQWRVIQIALSQPTLITKVIDTSLVRDGYSLANLLAEAKTIFFRSRSNTRRGEFAYLGREKGLYKLKICRAGHIRNYRSKSILDIINVINRILGDTIAQPYFKRLSIEGHSVKIRSVWQKNIHWKETFATVILSKKDFPDGPFFTGGVLSSFEQIFEQYLKMKLENIKFQIQSTAMAVIELFNSRVQNISELAIDLIIDHKGKVFFDSASTYTGLLSLNRLRSPGLKQQFINNTLEFALALYNNSFTLTSSNREQQDSLTNFSQRTESRT